MENSEKTTGSQAPGWLKILQENSWELELLISGGAIFTLFQMSGYWVESFETMRISFPLMGAGLYLMIGALGIEVLKIGFIVHLILRAFWISMVCLNYAYPQGINENKIKWQKPFGLKLDEDKGLSKIIVNVDRLSGIVMFLSISSTFLLAGIMFTIFLTISLPSIINIDLGFINQILFLFASAYLIDYLTFGFLRKLPYVSYLIFPFFIFFDFITFRALFKRSLLLLFTNVSKWKFVLTISVYLVFALTLSYLNIYRVMHWPNVFDKRDYKWQMAASDYIQSNIYKDQLDVNYHSAFYIQSKIIKDNFLELFIRYDYRFDELLELSQKTEKLKFISDLMLVYIDDKHIKDIDWHPTWHKNVSYIGA